MRKSLQTLLDGSKSTEASLHHKPHVAVIPQSISIVTIAIGFLGVGSDANTF